MPRAAKKPVRKPRNNRKKPVRRNAYKPANKRALVKSMMPLAEGRKTVHTHLSPKYLASTTDENWQVFIPSSWEHNYRESFLEELDNSPTSQGFTGKTLFSRYINQKLNIYFANIEHINVPVRLEVIAGWCKVPYITPDQSTGNGAQRNLNGVLIRYEPSEMISRELANTYGVEFPVNNPKKFKLKFKRNYMIKGRTIESTGTGGGSDIDVVRNDIKLKFSWTPNKKYHMTPATLGNGVNVNGQYVKPDDGAPNFNSQNPSDDNTFWTPSHLNNQDLWIPFTAIQIKNPDSFGRDKMGHVSNSAFPYLVRQDTHYFLDV